MPAQGTSMLLQEKRLQLDAGTAGARSAEQSSLRLPQALPASSSSRGENMVVFRSRWRSASLCACSGVTPAAIADLMAGAYTCTTHSLLGCESCGCPKPNWPHQHPAAPVFRVFRQQQPHTFSMATCSKLSADAAGTPYHVFEAPRCCRQPSTITSRASAVTPTC